MHGKHFFVPKIKDKRRNQNNYKNLARGENDY